MSLTLFSVKTSAKQAEIPKPDFSCISRQEKESIASCFAENEILTRDLDKAVSNPTLSSEWENFIGIFVLGLVGGMVLQVQLEHR